MITLAGNLEDSETAIKITSKFRKYELIKMICFDSII